MTDNKDEKRLAGTIRARMAKLRDLLAAEPDSLPVAWVLAGRLACSQRPLRDRHEFMDVTPLPRHAGPYVIEWIETVRNAGVRSVICLMHPKELRYYDGLSGMEAGLLDAYRCAGLQVAHLPWPDPFHGKTAEERQRRLAMVESIKKEALEAFRALPESVLVHCSAAIDRSPPVAAYIALNAGDAE